MKREVIHGEIGYGEANKVQENSGKTIFIWKHQGF
jgi:hypothetical protein